MDAMRICPGCQKPLAPNAPDGLCPECLIKAGLGSDVELGSDSGIASAPRPLAAPTPDEVARLFPQLEILGFIGQGGMGAVYKARQKELDRVVALKLLPPGIGQDPAFAERFTREAKAPAVVGFFLAVPVIGFGMFFPFAMLNESGGWNPALSEAVLVPLTWLGALLLPLAGWRLLKSCCSSAGLFAGI